MAWRDPPQTGGDGLPEGSRRLGFGLLSSPALLVVGALPTSFVQQEPRTWNPTSVCIHERSSMGPRSLKLATLEAGSWIMRCGRWAVADALASLPPASSRRLLRTIESGRAEGFVGVVVAQLDSGQLWVVVGQALRSSTKY